MGDPADCRLIANRCHPDAPESDVAHECHEVGHEGASPKRCSELRPSYERACPPRDPDSGTGGETACETLGRVCHDVGEGRPEECHEIGHDGDERVCEEKLAECLAVCQGGGM